MTRNSKPQQVTVKSLLQPRFLNYHSLTIAKSVVTTNTRSCKTSTMERKLQNV